MGTHIFSRDRAENSIMQTITIAVSAILIAAGLVTIPNLIVNARDNNAHLDLGSIAYAQESMLLSSGVYFPLGGEGQPDIDSLPASINLSLSGGTTDHIALICDAPNTAYLLRATSSSGTFFYRASTAPVNSKNITDLAIPQCIEEQIAVYDASNPDPFLPTDELVVANPNPDPGTPGGGNNGSNTNNGNGNANGNGSGNCNGVGNPNCTGNGNANGNNGNGNANGNANGNGNCNGVGNPNCTGNGSDNGNGNSNGNNGNNGNDECTGNNGNGNANGNCNGDGNPNCTGNGNGNGNGNNGNGKGSRGR